MFWGEIAGMEFARCLTGITFTPYVLDVLMMYGYDKEAATASTKKSRRLPETAKERKVDMLTTSIDLIQKYDYLEDKFKKGYES